LLLSDVYTWSDQLSSNTLEVYVHHLRQKLPAGAIETVRGQGYRLVSACLHAA
ncbi:MAG: winged helix-turn-helix domain-containing protein, partial [Vitreoscilla sp.]|nr:winged helix-turn-helix domain-containing protein [Vitreoscilla sp.]